MMRPGARGFTLIEVVVAILILSVGVLAWVGTGRVVSASVRQAELELRVARLVQEEARRLGTLPIDSLRDGASTSGPGDAFWIVQDSGAYLRVELVVEARPEGGRALRDTVFVYRPR